MRNKRFKHKRNKRKSAKHTQIKRFKPAKHTQIKRFKPAELRLREKRLLAVQQEAESRYQYHQLRIRSCQQ